MKKTLLPFHGLKLLITVTSGKQRDFFVPSVSGEVRQTFKIFVTSLMISLITSLTFGVKAWANNLGPAPKLVDIILSGPPKAPYFSPKEITLKVDEQTLLVLDNAYDTSYTFRHEDFSQAVHTHFIQNSPNVDTTGIALNVRSKTMWLLTPKTKGKYRFYASTNSQTNTAPQYGWITIEKDEESESPSQSQNENNLLTNEQKPQQLKRLRSMFAR